MRFKLLALAIAIIASYIGSYIALLKPMDAGNGLRLRWYRIDRNVASTAFAPLEANDRHVRPGFRVCEG